MTTDTIANQVPQKTRDKLAEELEQIAQDDRYDIPPSVRVKMEQAAAQLKADKEEIEMLREEQEDTLEQLKETILAGREWMKKAEALQKQNAELRRALAEAWESMRISSCGFCHRASGIIALALQNKATPQPKKEECQPTKQKECKECGGSGWKRTLGRSPMEPFESDAEPCPTCQENKPECDVAITEQETLVCCEPHDPCSKHKP